MKHEFGLIFCILLVFLCVGFVSAEDIVLDDTVDENVSHIHDSASNVVIEEAMVYASGGTFTDLKNIIDTASSGSIINITGDYSYNSGFSGDGISIGKSLIIVGNNHTLDALYSSRVFSISSGDVIINNLTFTHGFNNRGGCIYKTGGYLNLNYCVFDSNNKDSSTWGGAMSFWGGDFDIFNCTFSNNRVGADGPAFDIKSGTGSIIDCVFSNNEGDNWGGALENEGGTVLVYNCSFFNNTCHASHGSAICIYSGSINISHCVFVGNNRNTVYNSKSSIICDNWWGVNNPDFDTLTDGVVPDTWVIMDFVNISSFTGSSGSITFLSSLDTVYNSVTGNYSKLIDFLPYRRVLYSSSSGSLSKTSANINHNDTVVLSYSGVSYLRVDAEIDNQVLSIGTSDMGVNVLVSNSEPSLLKTFNYTIFVTNNGDDARNVMVNLSIPSILEFKSDSGDGAFDNNTSLWTIGDMDAGETISLNICVKVPYNLSLINNEYWMYASINGLYFDFNTLNNTNQVNITIRNKTVGSYTELQELIDSTPTGGSLTLPWNVEYDPIEDISLIEGMKLNKKITLYGNGYTISGLNQARIFKVSNDNILLKDLILRDGVAFEISRNYYSGGAIYDYANNLTVINCSFIENYADSWGSAIELWGDNGDYITITNCSFINNTAGEGGTVTVDAHISTGYITGCLFEGNTGRYESALYLSAGYANYNAFINNTADSGHIAYENGADFNYNWWGTNTPDLDELIYANRGNTPETYIVMNFTNLNPINSTGGTVTLKTSLNTLYNTTSDTYSQITKPLPVREIEYTSTSGTLSTYNSTIILENLTNLTYPSGLSTLTLSSRIDNQILYINTADIKLTINVTDIKPQLIQTITYTLTVENNGDGDARDITVSFIPPSEFIYQYYNGDGTYNITKGEWIIGELNNGEVKTVNITVQIPYNISLVNHTFESTGKVKGTYIDFDNLNDYSSVNVTVQNINGGSYTLLQYFIDNTATGDVLDLNFNVTYDPIVDAPLIEGMKIDKKITIQGNGYTISGDNQARIFKVSGDNVLLKDLILREGVAFEISRNYYSGGTIYDYANNLTVINCSFIENYADSWGSAIELWGDNGDYITIINSSFINNTAGEGGTVTVDAHISTGYITGCLFEGNTGQYQSALYLSAGYANYNAFINNTSDDGYIAYENGADFNYNWWGTNNPNLNELVLANKGNTPETYFIMNFTNTTPITRTGGTSTLQVTLNTIYNTTTNNYTLSSEKLPTRTVTYQWTTGNINPQITSIQDSNTSIFTYPTNMSYWRVNATIDNQTLTIGSTDLGIHITSDKNPVNDGDNLTINITIINNGLMDAYDINISISFPTGFLITNHTNNTGIYNNTLNIWYLDIIHPSENYTISFNGTLQNPGKYLIINATILNNTSIYEENYTNNTHTLNITVIQWSNLEIRKNISNPHPKTKENITYIITVTNYGPSTARNITVIDNLSSKLIFQYYTSTIGEYNHTTGVWFINNMTPNTTETLNITVLINESGVIENQANVTSINNDTNLTNNQANINFETPALSDLWVTINMEPQTSNYITYHIQAGNNGIEPSNGTIVELNINNLMNFVNHTTDKGLYDNSTGVWDIGYLKVNETVNLTLILSLNFPTGLNITNLTTSVNITSWSTDLYPENNTDNITFEAEIYGNFRLLQQLIDNQPADTIFILPRNFAYDPINDAYIEGETYNLINGISIYKNITIVNPHNYIISGFKMARCLNLTSSNVIIDGLKLCDGYSPLGAAINILSDNIQILRTTFTNNYLWGDYGGAIFISGENILIQSNTFTQNIASKLGGAIGIIKTNNLKIISNTFINNTVESDTLTGGAIGIINSTNININYNVFLDNTAPNSNKGNIFYIENTNINIDANWYGTNNPDFNDDKLIYVI